MCDLNAEQLAAIGSTAETTVVPAGPGSGKSRALVGRAKYQLAHGMDPREIVILTFTNAAAHVFAERLAPVRVNYMGTVHGFCIRLIQTYGHFLGYRPHHVSIVSEAAKKVMLSATREKLGRKITDKELHEQQTPYAKLIWLEYRYSLKRANMVDYDQILVDGLELLLRVAEVRAHIAIRELLGDELQDSGPIDWDIIWAIPAETRWLTGDVDQSIYAFRGGSPEIFMHAATLAVKNVSAHAIQLVSGGQEFPLTLNYRSDIAICRAANNLIRHNLNRIDKPIVSVSEKQGDIEVKRYNHEGEEIYGVWGAICAITHTKGVTYDEIAVLARTNTLVEKYRETLRGLGLPIKCVGCSIRMPHDWFFALTCISLIIDPGNDFHAEEVLRARGDSPESIQKWKLFAAREGVPLTVAAKVRWPEIPEKLDDLLQTLVLLGVSDESCNLIQQRISVLPNADATISDLLADLWRNDTWNVEDKGVGVTVCTMHAAKGHEWDVVFVVALEEGILPHFNGTECATSEGEIEEERRLCFVAITRARHMLFLSHAAKRAIWYKDSDQTPSRFIKEMES